MPLTCRSRSNCRRLCCRCSSLSRSEGRSAAHSRPATPASTVCLSTTSVIEGASREARNGWAGARAVLKNASPLSCVHVPGTRNFTRVVTDGQQTKGRSRITHELVLFKRRTLRPLPSGRTASFANEWQQQAQLFSGIPETQVTPCTAASVCRTAASAAASCSASGDAARPSPCSTASRLSGMHPAAGSTHLAILSNQQRGVVQCVVAVR